MPEKTLGDILTKIGDDAQSSLGMTREQVITLAERKKVLVGGTVDQNFNVTIKNGKGSVDESKYTFGVTITGYFVIQSPSQGTWDIVAKVADKTVVNKSGVSKGEQIPFTADTNFWSDTDVNVSATWSNKADTTLTVRLNASY